MTEPKPQEGVGRVFEEAVAAHERGRLAAAETLYRAVLADDGGHPGALHNLAILCCQRGDYAGAAAFAEAAVERRPQLATAHNTLAVALKRLGRLREAEQCGRTALRLAPDYAEAHNTLADILLAAGRFAEAAACGQAAVRLAPGYAEAYNNLGTALLSLGQLREAELCCRHAVRLKPGNPAAHGNLGTVLVALGRLDDAETSYRQALQLNPADPAAHNNLGTVLVALGRLDAAAACYREAVRLDPDNADAWGNLGDVLDLEGNLAAAVTAFERAAALRPDDAAAQERWFSKKRTLCDWRNYQSDEETFKERLKAEPLPAIAFRLLATSATLSEQLSYARRAAAALAVPPPQMMPTPRPKQSRRRRIGYLFLAHPTGHLIAGVLEHHDRSQFNIIGFCASIDDGAAVRGRLAGAVDHFADISELQDHDAARLINEHEIDVLVDLIGFKPNTRARILAYRPAPIQVNYLGFPGTMGARFIDYIIADRVVAPAAEQRFFSERLVHLPGCYQCNDDRRAIASPVPQRRDCGLPEAGFVFCCFNDSYKLTPAMFDIWMRLLGAVPGSVLWLLDAAPGVRDNLGEEAEARGIGRERLVFAPRLPLPEHLARHRLADLFLDTLPCNAHTTASDALWAGLPLLTCPGATFAGRVAASLLRAIGLDELITTSLAEYESLALRLARNRALLRPLRARLAHNRDRFPLFDTARSTRHLEAAYQRMCAVRQAGHPPTAFAISDRPNRA
jgi:protein O-GlcNAc transferase